MNEKLVEDMIKLVLLSMFIERAMAFLFEWKPVDGLLKDRSFKAPLTFTACLGVCFAYDFNVFASIFPGRSDSWPTLSKVMTAGILAGGSAGAIKLFQDVMGFSKAARDAKRDAQIAEAEARKEKAALDRKLTRKRAELELASLDRSHRGPRPTDLPEPWERGGVA